MAQSRQPGYLRDYYQLFTHHVNSQCDFQNLFDHVILHKTGVFVEIGCWQGGSSCYLALRMKHERVPAQLYCIDTWQNKIDGRSTKDLFIEHAAKLNLTVETFGQVSRLVSDIVMIQGQSVEKLKLFGDQSIDFIFLDGDHSYPTVLTEIRFAQARLKPDGWLGGHDLPNAQVRAAIDKTIGLKNIEEWKASNSDALHSWLWKREG